MSVPFDVPHPVLDSTTTTTTASTVDAVVVVVAAVVAGAVDVVGCQFKTNELMAMKILAVSVE